MDKRHEKRMVTVQNLFAYTFSNKSTVFTAPHDDGGVCVRILSHLPAIDETIVQHAPRYPIAQIAKVDLAILRLAVYELHFVKEQPVKVIVNEAIELAKELGGERSHTFINGVLGKVLNEASEL